MVELIFKNITSEITTNKHTLSEVMKNR